MFEIVYKEKVYKVYSVRDNQVNNLPEFLIYINYHWAWLPCFECSPIERYKIEENYKDDKELKKACEDSQASTDCNHQFEPADEGGSYTSLDGGCKTYTVYRCKYCGEMKKVY